MISFITSNKKKAADFKDFGFGVKEFLVEVPEIKSPNVEEVSLYKAKDTNLNNIVVEDSSLYVESSHFWGTDIKHVYSELLSENKYDNHSASWKICLCLKKDENYYLSVGETKGKIKYPFTETGYHFERFFAVEKNNKYIYYSQLSSNEQKELSPRFKALTKLKKAIDENDFSSLIKIPVATVKDWTGDYQIEGKSVKRVNKLN